jgi:hypothetical protein
MLLRSITAAIALAAIAAAPAKAAPTLSGLKPCFVAAREDQREFVPVQGDGFTPLAHVSVFVDDILQDDSAVTTIDGSLSGWVKAPFPEVPQRTFVLRVTEQANTANTVSITSMVTRLSVDQVPQQASTSVRVRFRGRGFTQPLPVYAHYVFAGKSRRTVELGMPTAPCGVFSVKRKQFPFKKRPQVGVWTIQFDQEARYNPQAAVRVPLTVKVRRRIKPQPARRSAS